MKLIEKIVGKIQCAFGNHLYHPTMYDFTFVSEEGDFWRYKVSATCFRCGDKMTDYVLVPIPKSCKGVLGDE